jgi:hypothetical protein
MVAGPGIEPGTRAYETLVLPLHYPAIKILAGPPGFEPGLAESKSAALPLR